MPQNKSLVSEEPSSFILKIQNDELERRLFVAHSFYVSIKRDWMRGTHMLFVRKDAFIGSGTIDRIVMLDDLQEEEEKKMCIKNNWYAKIIFSKLARFLPTVPVQDTLAAAQNPLALHGASISGPEALQIEILARAKIIIS
ncbi:MAG: hypothetical protein QXX64_02805 [Nitrososphaera sp.]